MPVRAHCPGCDSDYRLSDHFAGKTIRCKKCGHTFKVAPALPEVVKDVAEVASQSDWADEAPPVPKRSRRESVAAVEDVAEAEAMVEPDEVIEAITPEKDMVEDVAEAPPKKRGKVKAAAATGGRKGKRGLMMLLAVLAVLLVIGGAGAYIFWSSIAPMLGLSTAKTHPNLGPKLPPAVPPPAPLPKAGGSAKPAKEEPIVAEGPVSYVSHVRPFLDRYCVSCHRGKQAKGGADLTTFEGLTGTGRSDRKFIEPMDPEKSLIVLVIEHKEKPPMPPQKGKTKQPQEVEKDLLRRWVSEGAKDDSPPKDAPKDGAMLRGDSILPLPFFDVLMKMGFCQLKRDQGSGKQLVSDFISNRENAPYVVALLDDPGCCRHVSYRGLRS